MNAVTVQAPTEITERVYIIAMDYLAEHGDATAEMREMDGKLAEGGSLTNDEIRRLYVMAGWTKLASGN